MYSPQQQAVYERVVRVLCERIKREDAPLSPSAVKPESDFIKDLRADSLTVMELVMDIEKEFDLGEIPEADIEKIRTVDDVIQYLNRALNLS